MNSNDLVWNRGYLRGFYDGYGSPSRVVPVGRDIGTDKGGSRTTATILVVDDEPMIRELLQEMLESIGYKVKTAGDGKAALDYFCRHKDEVDLVILDVMMPGMSGVEVFRRLKLLDPSVKAILASGYVERSQLSQAMEEGVADFIAKPFALAALKSKLDTVLA